MIHLNHLTYKKNSYMLICGSIVFIKRENKKTVMFLAYAIYDAKLFFNQVSPFWMVLLCILSTSLGTTKRMLAMNHNQLGMQNRVYCKMEVVV